MQLVSGAQLKLLQNLNIDNEGYEQLIASENEEFIAEEGENGEN